MNDETGSEQAQKPKRKSKLPEFTGENKVFLGDYVKKKRRWAFFWGFVVSLIVFCVIQASMNLEPDYPGKRDQIAEVVIDGGIFDDEYRLEMLREIRKREDVRALILQINSGGGAVYPSEQIYQELRKISENIPVVSVMEDMAASGAYMVALGSDHIIAGETTVTGSIGVIAEMLNLSDVMDRWGVETTLIRSSESKGGISPLRDPTPEEIADEEAIIENMYQWFRGLVGERRGLSGIELNQVATGQVFTGKQALELGLVDELGGSYLFISQNGKGRQWADGRAYPGTNVQDFAFCASSSCSFFSAALHADPRVPVCLCSFSSCSVCCFFSLLSFIHLLFSLHSSPLFSISLLSNLKSSPPFAG